LAAEAPAKKHTLADGDGVPILSLRPKQAQKALNIGARSLWVLTNQNLIPHVRVGKCILYPVDQLREWLAERAKGGRP
jgi:hypothetical protein